MQLVTSTHDAMDLSVRKMEAVEMASPNTTRTSEPRNEITKKKTLSFSVDRLLKSSNSSEDSKLEGISVSLSQFVPPLVSGVFSLSNSCLNNSPMGPSLPIRPLVTNPIVPPPGSLQLLQSLYMPTMYSHQVLVRPPDLFHPGPGFLPMHHGGPHHLNPMGNGKRKKSWTQ